MESESEFLQHAPCPSCGSKDNLARYTDGHAFCFGCGYYEPGEGEEVMKKANNPTSSDFLRGEVKALTKRHISEATCQKYGYRVGTMSGKPVQIADYRVDGKLVAQKIRFPNKDFAVRGDFKAAGLFGSHLWNKGKKIVVTEGEIDALSMSTIQGDKWPVVSVPNGAQGAAKAIARNLDYFDGFDEVILMFDQDEPGLKAAQECAELFEPGKAKIASFPLKDPNEMLVAGKAEELIKAMWDAKPYRPDNICNGKDLWKTITEEQIIETIDYPWSDLNRITRGARKGELVTWAAGSGVGKSAIMRELVHQRVKMGKKVGVLMLEENVRRTALGIVGIEMGMPLHLMEKLPPKEEMKEAFDAILGSGNLFLYDHFGSTDVDNLLARIRYLAKGCGCDYIILDHLSIVVSGLGDGDERRLIDNAMTSLRTLVQETNISLDMVSHLRRPQGERGYEQGLSVTINALRGSHAIAQLSDMVIGLERDQQGEKPNETTLRVLKNRFSGETGEAGCLTYNHETGRLSELCGFDLGDNDVKIPF